MFFSLVVDHRFFPSGKASASRAEGLGSIPTFAVDLIVRSTHTSDFNIDTPVATVPGVWRFRISTGNGWPGVNVL